MAFNNPYGYPYAPAYGGYSQYPNNTPPVMQQQPQVAQPLNQQQQTIQTQPTQNQPVQNGGFISVKSENEVFNFPVAPGNYMTFKIEGKPIVMEKSMGFSQFEAPHIKRYKLIEEEITQNEEDSKDNNISYAHKEDVEGIQHDLKEAHEKIESLEKRLIKLEKEMEEAV